MKGINKKYNRYDLSGDFGIGYTSKGEEFYFDLEDYDKIKDICWNLHGKYIEGRDTNSSNKNQTVKIHRIIMGAKKGEYVDHINHNEKDNRKENLRICTNQENCMNRSTSTHNKSSGKSGISWRKDSCKWRVRIWKNYKCYNIGQFDTYEEAYEARIKAEDEFFKEFANLSEREKREGELDE